MSKPAHRIDVVIAMTKAATDLGWSPWLAESADDEVTVTVQPGPASSINTCPRRQCRGFTRHSWLRHWFGWATP